MRKALFYTFCVCCTVLVAISLMGSSKGIVAVEGFDHGVALCQGGEDIGLSEVDGIAHTWKKDGIFYTVNYGYLKHPLVKDLQETAGRECSNYLK